MKILEPGKHEPWGTQQRCTGWGNGGGGCSALLLVEEDDIFCTYSHARDEESTHFTFQCPECQLLTDITDTAIPARVQSKARVKGKA